MAGMNSADVANRWANALGAAGPKIRAGVEAVTESPMQKAAARQDAWVQGVMRARDEGTFAAGLNSVTLASWKDSMISKGINRIGTGATAAVPKMVQFYNSFLPFLENARQNLNATQPRGDLNQNIGRMVSMVQAIASFKSR